MAAPNAATAQPAEHDAPAPQTVQDEKPAPSSAPASTAPSHAATAPASDVKPAPAALAAAQKPATPSPRAAVNGNREFLALSSSSYIVELAHGVSRSELEALRTSLHPSRGELYELHLQRDGNDWWLLVWGAFDSVDAARAARSELSADAPINAGWPRPVAALQNEARRTGD
jgi:septal ring-binding cell division protein DamX